MQYATSVVSWIAILFLMIPLALMLLLALPTGCLAQIAAHTALLVGGAGVTLALAPRSDSHQT